MLTREVSPGEELRSVKSIVACERKFHRFGMLFPKLGAALDVGKEKGNAAVG